MASSPGALASLDPAEEWLNSPPLCAAGLRGNVVAVQFCTYSCINWIRTLPYVRAWHDAYADRGLVIVGAHAPEFRFEREIEGVRRALQAMRVAHPVVLDNGYEIWDAFANRFWPALYVLDGDGEVRYRTFGEGNYEESELAIQQLLGIEQPTARVEPAGVEAAADWDEIATPETYVGSARGERRTTGDPELNHWTLDGEWATEDQAVVLENGAGSIAFRFRARDLNLVMTPTGAAIPFTVRVDGESPGAAHGVDVGEDGPGELSEPRVYQLVRQPAAVAERTFEIAFEGPGARAYVFTFG